MSFTIFQRKLVLTVQQMVMDNLNVFNAASNGAIVLGNGEVVKDFVEQMTIGLIDDLVSDRDAYAPAGTTAETSTLVRLLTNYVNLSAKVGPVTITNATLAKIESDVNAAAGEVATQATEAIINWYLSAGLGAVGAAILGNSAAVYAQPPRTPTATMPAGALCPQLADFPLAASLFGDQAGALVTWTMTGAQWAQFEAYQAIPSAEKVFALGNLKVMQDGFGRKFLISDAVGKALAKIAPATGTTKPGENLILGLTPGAVQITTNGLRMFADQILGEENVRSIWQGEFDFSVALKGYRYKDAGTFVGTNGKSFKVADVTKVGVWEGDAGEVGAAGIGAAKGKTQTAPKRSIKETAGVAIQLTAVK